MLKAARLGGLIPPILRTSHRSDHGRPDRQSTLLFAGALSSFGIALMLAGAAACIAAGAPLPLGLDQSAIVFAAPAAACGMAAIGMLLALRERNLRAQHLRRITRAEQIQNELDHLDLTPKEMPIAKLILQHKSYADIAADRHLAVRTVQFHATNIFRKAYVNNRRDFEHAILADERDPADPRRGVRQGATLSDTARQDAAASDTILSDTILPNNALTDNARVDARAANMLREDSAGAPTAFPRPAPSDCLANCPADRPFGSPTTVRSRFALQRSR